MNNYEKARQFQAELKDLLKSYNAKLAINLHDMNTLSVLLPRPDNPQLDDTYTLGSNWINENNL